MELIVASQMIVTDEGARSLPIRDQNDVVIAYMEYSGKDSIGLCLDPFGLRGAIKGTLIKTD